MNRRILWKICLVLLPAIAVSVACVPGTVLVWGEGIEAPLAFGYFDMLPEGAVRLATPFAAAMPRFRRCCHIWSKRRFTRPPMCSSR